MGELRDTKCIRCRCYRYPSDFIKQDRVMKTCIICRENSQKERNKKKSTYVADAKNIDMPVIS